MYQDIIYAPTNIPSYLSRDC